MHRAEEAFGGVVPRPNENLPAPLKPGAFGFEKAREGDTNDWLTPPRLVRRLGEFDLDPCACVGQPWPLAKRSYAPPRNGLLLPWEGRVWCNPPYGPHVEDWAKRMGAHRNGILLIFSRTETQAWRWVWQTGDAFLFPEGRVSFYRPDGKRASSGTAPSALIAYGEANVEALRSCGIKGAFFTNVELIGSVKASGL
jgi:hypothetical protein